MINANNYFKEIAKIDISALPVDLKRGHNHVVKVSSKGNNWTTYETNELVQQAVDKYFELLNAYLNKKTRTTQTATRSRTAKKASVTRKKTSTAQKTVPRKTTPKKTVAKKKVVKKPVGKKDIIIGKTKSGKNVYERFNNPKHRTFTAKDHQDAELVQMSTEKSSLSMTRREEERASHARKYNALIERTKKERASKQAKNQAARTRKTNQLKKRMYRFQGQQVERIPEELRFIKRFVLLHGKTKTPDQIRLFINALQKAITEKRIRKTSQFAAEIIEIQDALLSLHAKLRGRKSIQFEIGEERRSHFLNITGKQKLLPSVRFIKSYIGLQGRKVQTTAVKNLLTRIEKAISTKAVPPRDPYNTQITAIAQALKTFVSKNRVEGTLLIPSRELNGLSGIVDDLEGINSFSGLSGFNGVSEDTIIRGSELAQMDFPTIGFRGKWLNFIGDPTRGFTAMVFGKPKFGKSALCIDFADYLSKNHGEVLYVAREEQISGTLKDKMMRSRAYEVNYTSSIPHDLSPYQFVFLDSITMLGLSTYDLEYLREQYPEISFVFIFQTTKQGAFRGSNEYQHNVDIVIEIPEIGQAVQYGRFNQGGEMNIF